MKKLLLLCSLAAIFIAASFGIAEKASAQTTTTLIHYWNFNTLAGPYIHPNIPHILADYTIEDSAYLEYYLLPGTSAGWAITGVDSNNAGGAQIDNVASTDVTNLRQGAVSGLALRARNPTDSCELRWHIPSTGFTNLVVTFATETSSLASGDSAQVYSYSVDGGKTWDSTGMTVNGAPGNILDLTQDENASSIYLGFGPVVITFGSNTAVNNNPSLIFRIVFRGNTHPNTPVSGNNRFDDFTVDGVGSSGPPPPPPALITMITPVGGSIFVPGQKALVSFHASSTVGQVRTIQFSPDSGKTWLPAGTITGDTSTTLTVPNVATTKGLVSVTDSAGVTASAGPFIIYPVPANNLIVDYWAFNTLNGAYYTPNIPNFPADFTAPGTTPGYIQYVNLAKTNDSEYIDNVAGDTVNAQLGAWAGNGLRVRNPTNMMQLIFWIPTTGFQGITLSYALQSSSFTGPQVQHFAYNTGNGIWTAAGITVNGPDSTKDSLDVTQSQYQQANGYGRVAIGFTSAVQAAISNNPNFQFRIIFGDTATGGTSGNNRFDNLTVSATNTVAPDAVNVPVQAEQQLELSPNPAGDYVSFENPYTSPINVSVLDVLGREVIHSDAVTSSMVSLNTSNLPSGTYYLRIQDVSSGASQSSKFVKE